MSQYRRNGRHFTPPQEIQTFLLYDDLKHFLRLIAFQFILGEEKHAYTVFSLTTQFDFQRLYHLLKKFMGNLRQNSHAITCFSFRILTGTMLQVFHNLQSIFHCLTAFSALDIDAGTDTAVIMFKGFPI